MSQPEDQSKIALTTVLQENFLTKLQVLCHTAPLLPMSFFSHLLVLTVTGCIKITVFIRIKLQANHLMRNLCTTMSRILQLKASTTMCHILQSMSCQPKKQSSLSTMKSPLRSQPFLIDIQSKNIMNTQHFLLLKLASKPCQKS